MAYPPVVIVNEQDEPVGLELLKQAWVTGHFYRVSAVVVEDESGQILLQKRADGMDVDPGKWDISVAGHVDEGRTYETAAIEEMAEEVGLAGMELQPVKKVFLSYMLGEKNMNYFLQIYHVKVSSDTALRLAADEVSETQWLDRSELKMLIEDHPGKCARLLHEMYAHTPSFSPAAAAVA